MKKSIQEEIEALRTETAAANAATAAYNHEKVSSHFRPSCIP